MIEIVAVAGRPEWFTRNVGLDGWCVKDGGRKVRPGIRHELGGGDRKIP
jgi:hypothetical protein